MKKRIRIAGGVDPILTVARIAVVGVCLGFVTLQPTIAASQQANAQDQTPNIGEDLLKPPQNLFQLMYWYRSQPGSGSTPGSIATVSTDAINLRVDHKIDLPQQSTLAL